MKPHNSFLKVFSKVFLNNVKVKPNYTRTKLINVGNRGAHGHASTHGQQCIMHCAETHGQSCIRVRHWCLCDCNNAWPCKMHTSSRAHLQFCSMKAQPCLYVRLALQRHQASFFSSRSICITHCFVYKSLSLNSIILGLIYLQGVRLVQKERL